jgi:hypothetical protein
MRVTLLIVIMMFSFSGCGESKPDPRDHPNFVDTTDPNDLKMPGGAVAPSEDEEEDATN